MFLNMLKSSIIKIHLSQNYAVQAFFSMQCLKSFELINVIKLYYYCLGWVEISTSNWTRPGPTRVFIFKTRPK